MNKIIIICTWTYLYHHELIYMHYIIYGASKSSQINLIILCAFMKYVLLY